MTVRYFGTAATAAAAWKADRDLFAAYNCLIEDDPSSPNETYSRCTLQSANRLAPEKGTIAAEIIFDCRFDFTIEE